MQQKIVGVLGLGDFGSTLALELSRYGAEVIAIDKSPDLVQEVADEVTTAVIGDFTDIELLQDVGIANCGIVIIATGTNLESSVLAVMQLQKLKVSKIIAKARSATFEEVLYAVGVDRVIAPERDSAFRLASKILRNHIDEVLRLDDETSVIELEVPQEWVGKNLIELDLRNKYDINVIGIRQERGSRLNTISPNQPLKEGLQIVAIANEHIFEKYDYLGYFD